MYTISNLLNDIYKALIYLGQGKVIFILLCIALFIVLFLFFKKIIYDATAFSKSTSIVLALGLAIISTLAGLIRVMALLIIKLFNFFWNLGILYTILFFLGLILVLVLLWYTLSWILYPIAKRRKRIKEGLRKAGEKLLEKIGKGLEKGNIHR